MTDVKRPDPNPRITEPGIYPDVSNAEYHAHPSISSSQIVDACRSLAHFWANSPMNYDYEPTEPTEAMKRGSAVHCYLLEPDVFEKTYLVAPDKNDHPGCLDTIDDLKDFLKVEGIEFKASMKKPELLELARPRAQEKGVVVWADVQAEFMAAVSKAGAMQVTPEARRDYQRMGAELARQELELEDEDGKPLVFRLSDLFTVGRPEQSVFWRDRTTNLMCRVRPDWLIITPRLKLIIDYKTTRNADLVPFQAQAGELLYWMRAAMYKEGVREALKAMMIAGTLSPEIKAALGTDDPEKIPEFDYILLAQETERPFLAATYEYPEHQIELGQELYRVKMKQIAECRAKRVFPGYTRKLRSIEVRQYIYSRYPELESFIENGVSQFNQ